MTEGRDVETRLIIDAQMKGAQRVIQEGQKIQAALGSEKLVRNMKEFDKALESVKKNLSGTVRQVKRFDEALKGLIGSGSALRTLTQLMEGLRVQTEGVAAATQAIGLPGAQQGAPTPAAAAGPRGGGGGYRGGRWPFGQGYRAGQQFAAGNVGAGGGGIGRGFGRAFGAGGAAKMAGMSALVLAGTAIGGATGLSRLALRSSEEALQSRVMLQDLMATAAGDMGLAPWFQNRTTQQTLTRNQALLRDAQRTRAGYFNTGDASGLTAIPFTRTGSGGAPSGQRAYSSPDPRVRQIERRIADLQQSNEYAQKFLSPMGQREQRYREGRDLLDIISEQAGALGFTIPEAIGMQTRALQLSGHTAFSAGGFQVQQQALEFARLGLGPEAVGMIGQGRRLGAFGPTAGGDMNQLMEKAIETGLEQSEINRFLGDIASNVELFRQTGIPVAGQSILALGRTFSIFGAGSQERGMAMGESMVRMFQNIASRGPRPGSRVDIQALRILGDLPDNPSAEDLENARIQMERMVSDPAQREEMVARTLRFVNALTRGAGTGAGGRQTALAELQERGLREGSPGEWRRIAGVAEKFAGQPGDVAAFIQSLPPEDREFFRIGGARLRGGRQRAELERQRLAENPDYETFAGARAGAATDVAARRRAEQTNERIVATADNVLNAAQNFADVQVSAVTGTAKVLGETLKELSLAVADAVDKIKEKVERFTGAEPE